MKNRTQKKLAIASAILFTLFTAACKKGYDGTTVNPPNPPVLKGVQLTANDKFGNILTDNNGRSLYFFSKDVGGASACNGDCSITWPVFYKESPAIGTGLVPSDFAVITRADGTKQNTYKGWPLYYFMNDLKAGDAKGDAIGNLWAIAKADYTVMFGNAQLIGSDTVNYDDQSKPGTVISQYITDSYGRTLYQFKNDISNKNKFTAADFSNNGKWPIFEPGAIGSIPTVLTKTNFTTTDVFGRTQLVFKGHPMYFFGEDEAKRGNTKGVSFPNTGAAVWKVHNNNTPVL